MNMFSRYEKICMFYDILQKTDGNLNSLPLEERNLALQMQDEIIDNYYTQLSVLRDGYSCNCADVDRWECTCEDCYGFCDDDFYEYCSNDEPYYVSNIDNRLIKSGIEEVYDGEYNDFITEFNEYMEEYEVYDN